MSTTVFVSHSTKNDSIVNGIRRTLESLGVEVWTDSQRLTAGDPLTPKVMQAIEGCDHFLAVLSADGIKSPWVAKEIKHALALKKKVIPILLPPIEPSELPLLFGEEPLGVKLSIAAGGLAAALPDLLAALGMRQPTEKIVVLRAQLAPIADLVLELTNPSSDACDGSRRAIATATLVYSPPDGSPEIESQSFRYIAPLGTLEADDISWYLERYVNWPSGIFQERARRIEAALPQWGRQLYDSLSVEVSRDILETWKAAPKEAERRFTVKVDKDLDAGADKAWQTAASEAAALLLSLPWELIHDQVGYLFRGARGVRVRRSLPSRSPRAAAATRPPIRVLLVSPRPEDKSFGYIDHRVSARPLIESLSALGDLAEFTILDPPTFPALEAELERAQANPYHVVHFDGHGAYDRNDREGALCFEDPADAAKLERRRSQLIPAAQIAAVVRDHGVPLLFLEACRTAQAADDPTASVAGRLLESGLASIAAMSHSVLVETARRFVATFYTELLSGKRIGQAMLLAQRALAGDPVRGKVLNVELRLQDWFVPVLFQEEQDPQLIRELPPEEVRAITETQRALALGRVPAEPPYQFQGRSRELLKAERVLSRKRYVVVQGEGGEGKTTLAAELARWLVLTRRFERAAFVRLDVDGDARKILFSIGDQLIPNFLVRAAREEEAAWQLVEHALRETPTLIVLDNMESVLEPPADSEAHVAFDADVLAKTLDLCRKLTVAGRTHLIFTSREPPPEPFARNHLKIARLDRADAIRLVARVLGDYSGDVQSEQETEALVDAVGCHARALVLLAGEVGASGVRRATENLHQLMATLERKHPGKRERSLLASVQLSLRRLPAGTRQKIRPLGVFHGGGWLVCIGAVLGLDMKKNEHFALGGELAGVGLAEQLPFGYLRFDPALAPALAGEMTVQERDSAIAAWAQAVAEETNFLHSRLFKNAYGAQNLCQLDLANLVAALEYLAKTAPPEGIVELATGLEALLTGLNRPNAMSRVIALRTAAAQRVGGWSHAQFEAEEAAVERQLEQGDAGGAVIKAATLFEKAKNAGEAASAADFARAQFLLGKSLKRNGAAGQALTHLEEARGLFEKNEETRMAGVARMNIADCWTELGRYDEALIAYQEGTTVFESIGDMKSVAISKSRLARIHHEKRFYSDAVLLYSEALNTFRAIGDLRLIGITWNEIGLAHFSAGQPDDAEHAYQESVKIKVQTGDVMGEAVTLMNLGSLYSLTGRYEDAVRCYRQSAGLIAPLRAQRQETTIHQNLGDVLLKLRRYDEARPELMRALECGKPFGHASQPWVTLSNLSNLEHAVGNEPAAQKARAEAVQAYLAYRRDGGASLLEPGQWITGDPARMLTALQSAQDLEPSVRALIRPLQAILAGSRDQTLAEDPNLSYQDAAELLLLIERLQAEREQLASALSNRGVLCVELVPLVEDAGLFGAVADPDAAFEKKGEDRLRRDRSPWASQGGTNGSNPLCSSRECAFRSIVITDSGAR
jgi:tetratricopeptide (TPR) repeat protein